MKTPEDEAFEDIERRQGGFPAKRAMAADKLQDGKCKFCIDGCVACDAREQPAQEPSQFGSPEMQALIVAKALAQPVQEPVLHWSDCAVHNEPAYPAGECDCGAAQEPVAPLWECLGRWSAYLVANGKRADCAPPSWLVEAIRNATAAQSAQEPVAQWQKKHATETEGKWENTDEFDAKWWRDNSKGWEIRALYTAPPQEGK
jgi:hypothetical protein